MSDISEVTLNNKNKRSDNFYLTFYNIPESMGNILGRQAKNITRPGLNFEPFEQHRRGFTYKDKGKVAFDNVTMMFFDDEDNFTSNIIYAQVMRQLNRHTDVFGSYDAVDDREYRFDVKAEFYNSTGLVTESYTFKRCFISSVQHEDHNLDSDEEKSITVILEYDNLEVNSIDRLLNL